MRCLSFRQEECPLPWKEQIIALMKQEWPQAFEQMGEEVLWPDDPATQPTSFVLLDGNVVVSHVAIPWKWIQHAGQAYRAFGLSEVLTHPAYRKQGYGLKLVREATTWIEKNEPDIGVFTCQPPLVSFYRQGGWEHLPATPLVGGTRSQPFRSDTLGLSTMMRFFSTKAQQNRSVFEGADIYLELGENRLW